MTQEPRWMAKDPNTGLNSLEFLKDPSVWPNNPICPVKNYDKVQPGEMPKCGFVFDSRAISSEKHTDPQPIVYPNPLSQK